MIRLEKKIFFSLFALVLLLPKLCPAVEADALVAAAMERTAPTLPLSAGIIRDGTPKKGPPPMIRDRINNFRNRLFRIYDQEPLSKLSLCVIIALDIFILSVLFTGLADHTRQLTAPTDAIPYECREALVSRSWTEANRLDKLQDLVLSDYRNVSYRYTSRLADARMAKPHPDCREFFEAIRKIAEDKELLSLLKSRADLTMRKNQITAGFREGKDVYDTSLLENIAGQDPGRSDLAAVAGGMKAQAQIVPVAASGPMLPGNFA